MLSLEFWVGFALLVVMLLSTTANVALRHLSRVRLSELLEKRGKPHLLERLIGPRHDFLVTTSCVRICAIVVLLLLMTDLFIVERGEQAVREYVGVFIASMVLITVMGVTLPSAWARYAGEPFLLAMLPALVLLRYAFYPLITLQRITDGLIRRLAGIPENGQEDAAAEELEKEILDAVTQGELAGAVHEADADMIESVMEFRNTDVGQVMTPRTEVIALPDTATLIEAKELISREGHSRIPIYGDSIDEIKGVLYAKDLLNLNESTPFDPREIMRKVPFVPETKPVADLLQELREKKVHLAVVVDEYGGTAGLVTIEDIVEEVFGEIADEYEPPEPESIDRIDDMTLEVDPRLHIDELNEALGVDIPEAEDYDTIGGFIFQSMGKIPETGEEFAFGNLRFTVLDAEERKINRLRVQRLPDEAVA